MSLIEAALKRLQVVQPELRPRIGSNPKASRRIGQDAKPEPSIRGRRAYRILRARLLKKLAANRWASLAIAGTTSGHGKTLTTINLIVALAPAPHTCDILVDLDFQRSPVTTAMGAQFDRPVRSSLPRYSWQRRDC